MGSRFSLSWNAGWSKLEASTRLLFCISVKCVSLVDFRSSESCCWSQIFRSTQQVVDLLNILSKFWSRNQLGKNKIYSPRYCKVIIAGRKCYWPPSLPTLMASVQCRIMWSLTPFIGLGWVGRSRHSRPLQTFAPERMLWFTAHLLPISRIPCSITRIVQDGVWTVPDLEILHHT